MKDRRQLVLDRMNKILTDRYGDHFFYNRGEVPNEKRKGGGVLLLDGNEQADEEMFDRGRLGSSPNKVVMKPEIYVTLEDRKPHNEDVSRDLNKFRREILTLILMDQELRGIVGPNGELRYLGCVTDLTRDQAMNGEMGIIIAIKYPFIPDELKE